MSIGIDFKSTELVLAITDSNGVRVPETDTGHRSFAYFVAFDGQQNHSGFSASSKVPRFLTQSEWNIPLTFFPELFSFPFVSRQCTNSASSNQQTKPYENLQLILEEVDQFLKTNFDNEPSHTFLSLPQCLSSFQLGLHDVLASSGFHDVTIVDPIYCLSWSYLYKMNSRLTNQLEVILFLDIGYMCTDIGVVQMNNESANILLSKSSTSFRGQLLDHELLQLCVGKANQLFNQDVTQNKKAMFRLYQEIKKSRVNLSSCPEVELEIDSFIDGEDFEIDVDRRDFEARFDHHLLQLGNLLTEVDQFLVKNSLKLSKVVLLGGFSYVPVIETTIKSHFDYLQSYQFERTLNAFESISEGASLACAAIDHQPGLPSWFMSLTVTNTIESVTEDIHLHSDEQALTTVNSSLKEMNDINSVFNPTKEQVSNHELEQLQCCLQDYLERFRSLSTIFKRLLPPTLLDSMAMKLTKCNSSFKNSDVISLNMLLEEVKNDPLLTCLQELENFKIIELLSSLRDSDLHSISRSDSPFVSCCLSFCYLKGIGCKQNADKALEFYLAQKVIIILVVCFLNFGTAFFCLGQKTINRNIKVLKF
ncbi:hypothetical protein GEMRC1_004594 [Eukaryota sp. GEM-RC1]